MAERYSTNLRQGSHFLTGQTRNIILQPDVPTARKWVNETPNNGFIRFRTIWNTESIMITSPELLSEMLIAKCYNFEKRPFMAKIFTIILGNGVIFAEGTEHKVYAVQLTAGTRILLRLCQRQRKHLMPPFAFTQIKKLYPIFWRHSVLSTAAIKQIMVQIPDKNSDYTCDINEWASRVTLDIIGEAGMGRSFHSVDNPENELYKAYSTVFHRSSREQALSMLKTLLRDAIVSRAPYLAQFFAADANHPVVKAIRLIRGTCRELIADGRNSMEKKLETINDLVFKPTTTKENMLLSAVSSEAFSDEELVNQVMTFLLAGHESTASTLTMAVYYLCKHVDVQCRLREEIRNHILSPTLGLEISANDIRSLPYLGAVVEEVMRLAPAVPISGRVTVAETHIGQQVIPKGTTVLLASAAVNTSKKIWGEDALSFAPERWLTDGRVPKSPYANMTFLHGPRSCMGKDFARSTFACVLAAWVGRFELSLEDPTFTLTFSRTSLNLRVEGGVRVRMKEIGGW